MSKKKIAIVANCQARPLADALVRLSDDVDVTYISIVHLMKDNDKDDFMCALDEVDCIIAQLVNKEYPCEFVRTDFLKANFKDKLTSIVNLYFTAYTPEWLYMRIPEIGVLRGPMGDYHNRFILSGWKNKLSVSECALQIENAVDLTAYHRNTDKSLANLEKRENTTHVNITGFIRDNYKEKQLFFTFNHPSALLIVEYAKRILSHQNIKFNDSIRDLGGREPLSQFRPIVNSKLGLPGSNRKLHVGKNISLGEQNVEIGARQDYSTEEIIETFYRIYDQYHHLVQIHPLFKKI